MATAALTNCRMEKAHLIDATFYSLIVAIRRQEIMKKSFAQTKTNSWRLTQNFSHLKSQLDNPLGVGN
jgi:hypothetical protein